MSLKSGSAVKILKIKPEKEDYIIFALSTFTKDSHAKIENKKNFFKMFYKKTSTRPNSITFHIINYTIVKK